MMHFDLFGAVKPLAATAALLLAASPAFAGTSSSNLGVNATVTSNCTVSTNSVEFGSIDTVTGGNVDATGGITVACTNGTPWTAAASAGAGTGATAASRKMVSGSNLLDYTLFTDSSRTSVWGDGSGTTATIGNTGTGTAQTVTIYGRVTAGQTSAPAGSYADTVSVTVTY